MQLFGQCSSGEMLLSSICQYFTHFEPSVWFFNSCKIASMSLYSSIFQKWPMLGRIIHIIHNHSESAARKFVISFTPLSDVWPVPPHPTSTHIEDDTTSMFLLQLSCILHMVGSWGGTRLRVMATSPSQNIGQSLISLASTDNGVLSRN